ncbi:MAG: hypothetical protein ACTSR0_03965 [Candidatus Asgardarchaeia archaeon]
MVDYIQLLAGAGAGVVASGLISIGKDAAAGSVSKYVKPDLAQGVLSVADALIAFYSAKRFQRTADDFYKGFYAGLAIFEGLNAISRLLSVAPAGVPKVAMIRKYAEFTE